MATLERSLQKSIARRLNDLHRSDPTFVWRKRHGTAFGVAGDPDLYGSWAGVPWQIELKRPGQSPTELQQARLREWSASGTWTGVVNSMAALENALAAILQRRPDRAAMASGLGTAV
jgi:hypothetical protein